METRVSDDGDDDDDGGTLDHVSQRDGVDFISSG